MKQLLICVALACCFTSTARAEDVNLARQHYKRGTRAYDLGRYLEAVKEYEAAYEIKDDPALLFNIGQAYRLANDSVNAIRAYRSFLRRVPEAGNRAEVEARIIEMQKLIDQQAHTREAPPLGTLPAAGHATEPEPAPSTVVVTPPPVAPPAPEGPRRWRRPGTVGGLALIGGGVACLALGGAFTGLAAAADQDFAHPSSGVFDPTAESRRSLYQNLDVAFFAIGGVAAAAGVVLLILDQRRTHRVALLPSLTGAALAGEF